METCKRAMPKGLSIQRATLTEEEKRLFLASIDERPWSSVLQRRTQHYGGRYEYKTRSVVCDNQVQAFESCYAVKTLANKLTSRFIEQGSVVAPNQCIINEYVSKQSISAHTDAACFGPVICSVSLGDSTVMLFTHPQYEPFEIELHDGDILFLTGEARQQWKHQTKPIQKDDYRRISLTFRTMRN